MSWGQKVLPWKQFNTAHLYDRLSSQDFLCALTAALSVPKRRIVSIIAQSSPFFSEFLCAENIQNQERLNL